MDALREFSGVMPAIGIAIVTAAIGFKLKMEAEPGYLYIKLMPFFNSLLQARLLRQFEPLIYPLKASAYIVFRILQYTANIVFPMLQYTAYIPMWLGRGIGALFLSTFKLMPKLVQQRIFAIDHGLANDHWNWSHRFAPLIVHSLFPFYNNGPATALYSLANNVYHAAERSRRNAILRDILDRYEEVPLCNRACSIRFLGLDRKAEVQMVSTSLGLLDSLNAVPEKRASGENLTPTKVEARSTGELSEENLPRIEEEGRSAKKPAKSVYMEGIEELLDKPEYRHWMISIPNRQMAWHLYREDGSANIKIQHKESVEKLTTAAMGVKLTNYQKRSLGSTFLSKQFLIKLREIEERRKRSTGQDVYDLVNNNCQSLWANGMLDLLVCRCGSPIHNEFCDEHNDENTHIDEEVDDSGDLGTCNGPRFPSSIEETFLHRDWIIVYPELFMSVMIALGKRNILPLGVWRPWLSILTYVLKELNLTIFGPVFPALGALWESNIMGFCSLLAVIPLHTVISFMYHRRIVPSCLEWIDSGIGLIAMYWDRRIRRSNFCEEPAQPAMCWSSFFSQLYEMSENGKVDRTQLEKDIEAFLHTELY